MKSFEKSTTHLQVIINQLKLTKPLHTFRCFTHSFLLLRTRTVPRWKGAQKRATKTNYRKTKPSKVWTQIWVDKATSDKKAIEEHMKKRNNRAVNQQLAVPVHKVTCNIKETNEKQAEDKQAEAMWLSCSMLFAQSARRLKLDMHYLKYREFSKIYNH